MSNYRLNNEAHKKRFYPSNAYFIGGHGDEFSFFKFREFIVPPNCIIVAKVYSGALSMEYPELDGQFIELGSEVLKNPLKHINKLIEHFGSIRIYQPGDKCPNFEYTMLSCFGKKYCIPFSGLIDLDLLIKKTRKQSNNGILPFKEGMNKKEIVEYFSNLFHYSIFPTYHKSKIWISEILDIMEEDDIELNYKNIIQIIGIKCMFTQLELCKKKTGVFYNFSCRNIPGVTNLISSPNHESWIHPNIPSILSADRYIKATRKRIKTASNQAVLNTNTAKERAKRIENNVSQYLSSYSQMPAFKNVTPFMEATLKNRLNESLHRKKLIHNVNMTRKNNTKLNKELKYLDTLYQQYITYKEEYDKLKGFISSSLIYTIFPQDLVRDKAEYRKIYLLQKEIIELKQLIERQLEEFPRNQNSIQRKLNKYEIFNEFTRIPNKYNESKEEVD